LEEAMPICNHCLKEKDPEEFNWRYKALGIRHPTCRECQKPFRKNWYEGDAHERHLQQVRERKHEVRKVAREYVYQYLLSHPCSQCGEADPRVLEFHHVGGKDMAVSEMVAGGYSIERIQAEIDKSIVLCANCHRKVTMNDRGWFRGRR
jgi:hypothetical protein